MINEKKYYNKELEEVLNLYISKEKYGEFAPILQDIFQRRSYEFGFGKNQMIYEIQNFVKNVNSIKAVSEEELPKRSIMGSYLPCNNEIKINIDYYRRFNGIISDEQIGELMYETLTHEVYHAISDIRDKSCIGLCYKNQYIQEYFGTALNEICTETAADRACMSRNFNDALKGRRDTNGYSNITFIANMLAASAGVSEKQFLGAGLQNRGKLAKLILNGRLGEDAQEINETKMGIFDSIEANVDVIYNLLYREEKIGLKEEGMKHDLLVTSLTNFYIRTFGFANAQINFDTRENMKELSGELEYRFSKMERIMKDSLNDFLKIGKLSPEDIEKIKNNTIVVKENFINRISGIKLLEKQGGKIQDEKVLKEQIELAKQGKLYEAENIKMLQEKYGISTQREKLDDFKEITQDFKYSSYILREDFDNGKQWDNYLIGINTKKVIEKDFEKNHRKIGFFQKISNDIKNMLLKFKNRDLNQLPQPKEKTNVIKENNTNMSSAHETWAEQYRVSEEKFKPVEEVLRDNKPKNREFLKDENIIE